MRSIDKGSQWRKWDLHIHTPASFLFNGSKNLKEMNQEDKRAEMIKFIQAVNNSDAEVFCLMDYWTFDWYFELQEYNAQNPQELKKIIFPGIELRIESPTDYRLNIHCIFSDKLTKQELNDFKSELYILSIDKKLSDDALARFARSLDESKAAKHGFANPDTLNDKKLFELGAQTAVITQESLKRAFLQIPEESGYIILPYDTSDGLLKLNWEDHPHADNYFMQSAHVFESRDQRNIDCISGQKTIQNEKFFENFFKTLGGKPKPCISGSDAHKYTDYGKFPSNRITWIKADPSFEGFKQILYEPTSRVNISAQKPREPVRKIDSLKFSFPSSTFIKRNTSTDRQPFCLNQLNQEIFFSPYFTCIIGGRGTGKSTIINLLAERLGEKTEFFRENSLLVDGKKYEIESDTNDIISVVGTNEIEFVSQGNVERLAEGNELTKLIFDQRIRGAEVGFYSLDTEFKTKTDVINESTKLLFEMEAVDSVRKDKIKERATTQNIIDSINDERYKQITTRINKIREETEAIENSQIRYEKLLKWLRFGLTENTLIARKNAVEDRIAEILNLIKSIKEVSSDATSVQVTAQKFESLDKDKQKLERDFALENKKLKEFFEERGMGEETIKDSQRASENLSRINSEIQGLSDKIDRMRESFTENMSKLEDLSNLNKAYNQLVKSNLDQINSKLKIENENVLDINFSAGFNTELFKHTLFEEFYEIFSKHHISGTSAAQVKEVLFLIEPNEDLIASDYKTFKTRLESEIELKGLRRTNNYVKIVVDIFSSQVNFIVYKLLLRKNFYNVSKFIKITGFYGDRELINCSFGQRCTAVIVTLLMTGVKPLVVDEPEAHLDNRLIADYLVNLIKRKKLDRQIIFATHNSNFVVNGDAELIHILDIPMTSIFTQITSTSIENITHREKLLKLEGGREAFLVREQKYGLWR